MLEAMQKHNVADRVRYVYQLLDDKRAFGSIRGSVAAERAMVAVLAEYAEDQSEPEIWAK